LLALCARIPLLIVCTRNKGTAHDGATLLGLLREFRGNSLFAKELARHDKTAD
jgi:hypothetical protein